MLQIIFCLIVSTGMSRCSDNQEEFSVFIQNSDAREKPFSFKRNELPKVTKMLDEARATCSFMNRGSLRTDWPVESRVVSIFAIVSREEMDVVSEKLRLITTKPLRQS